MAARMRYVICLSAASVLITVACGSSGSGRTAAANEGPVAPVSTGVLPWTVPEQGVARFKAAGLPALNTEGVAVHYHAHLDVFVNGTSVTVPLLGQGCCVSPLHTHSESGLLHIETNDGGATYTLGNLFGLWGVRLTGDCVGGYCRPVYDIRVFVNGQAVTETPPSVAIRPSEEIVLVVGAPPAKVPSVYSCQGAADIERQSCLKAFPATG